MRITQLSKEAVGELERAFRKEKNGRQKIRYQALLLLAKGFKRKTVGEIVGISPDRIRQWVTLYHKHGLYGLKLKPAPGNHRLLTKAQKQTIKDHLATQTPQQFGFNKSRFWTIPLLQQLIKKEFAVIYKSPESYRRLFHFCGFTFHKPTKVNKRQNKHMKVRFEELLKKDPETGQTEKMTWSW